MTAPLLFSAFVIDTASHILHGLWRPPEARQSHFDSLSLWAELAQALERGLFDFLGFAFTSNIVQEHPFHFARKVSTLDRASRGRVAWNIVTNALPDAARNFGQVLTPHDERYEWAEEYMAVTYKLWEGSWDDGALVRDRAVPATHPAASYRGAFR